MGQGHRPFLPRVQVRGAEEQPGSSAEEGDAGSSAVADLKQLWGL